MLHPSYHDLMQVVNSGVEEGEEPVVSSRYSIVMATSKRARQLIAGDDALVDGHGKKPLSVAVEELNGGKIRILTEEEAAAEAAEEAAAAGMELTLTEETQEAEAAEEAEETKPDAGEADPE